MKAAHTHPYASMLHNPEVSIRVEVYRSAGSRPQRFFITIDPYGTFLELKEKIATRLQAHPSTILIEWKGSPVYLEENSVVDFLGEGGEIVVDIRRDDPPQREPRASILESISRSAASFLHPLGGQASGDDDDQYHRELQIALEESKITARHDQSEYKPSSRTYRDILSTTDEDYERKPQQRDDWSEYDGRGQVVVRGTVSQYSVGNGGESSCTSVCLAIAQWLLRNRTIGDLTPSVLDSLVRAGVAEHNSNQRVSGHSCLDDLWLSSPHSQDLERGMPTQSIASVKNFIDALNRSWKYALENGKDSVAVVFTKAPETVLCFGTKGNNGPEWYLIDSHGQTDDTEKVAYTLRFSTTANLAAALGVKYPLLDTEEEEEEAHYTLQMFRQFESTPLIVHTVPSEENVLPARRALARRPMDPETSTVHSIRSHGSHDIEGTSLGGPATHAKYKNIEGFSYDDSLVTELPRRGGPAQGGVPFGAGRSLRGNGRDAKGEGNPTRFIRRPGEAKGRNDLLIAVPLCKQADKVILEYARDTKTQLVRCMVTCCANIIRGESSKSCHRCGRVVCKDCRRFGVSSVVDRESFLGVCLDCGFDLLDSVDLPSLDAARTKAQLLKVVLEPRLDEIYTRAKQLLEVREDAKAARKHRDALIELTSKINALKEEKSRLLEEVASSTVDSDGDFEMDAFAGTDEHPPQQPAAFQSRESASTGRNSGGDTDTFEDWSNALVKAGRDKFPLPFGLEYPTSSMIENRDLLLSDLRNWVTSKREEFEDFYLAERERLREERGCLIEEVAVLRPRPMNTQFADHQTQRNGLPRHRSMEHYSHHQSRGSRNGNLEL